MTKKSRESRKAKPFEPDPDIGRPCLICGSIFKYRLTLKCQLCNKKLIINCDSPLQAMAMEDQLAREATHLGCGGKLRIRRWRTHEHHHVSYKEDKTVLLCYLCHQRLHGNAAISSHPFKRQYGKDIEPFIFAAHVTRIYVDSMPSLIAEEDKPEEKQELTKVEKKLNTTSH